MTDRTNYTAEEARRIGEQIGIDWSSSPFDVEQFRGGPRTSSSNTGS